LLEKPKISDVATLIAIAFFWGSAFSFIEIALIDVTPLTIAAARILVGALFLYCVIKWRRQSMPTDWANWRDMTITGLSGNAIPFVLIAWGQQYVDSSLSAILIAIVPLSSLFFAHIFTHDEKITTPRLIGFLMGVFGLMALSVGQDFSTLDASGAGIIAIVLATLGYGYAGIHLRKLRHLSASVSATGLLISSAIVTVPLAFIIEQPLSLAPSNVSLAALLYLGIFPSGLAIILVSKLVFRTGATFTALNNYISPMFGVMIGVLLLGEHITRHMIFAIILILSGIAITRIKVKAKS
jgi:drug/metabolite transporter (DMT)-like permease